MEGEMVVVRFGPRRVLLGFFSVLLALEKFEQPQNQPF